MKINIEQSAMSESIKNLAEAQVKVQKEIKDIGKDSEGYGYKYTSYDTLVKYLRPLLTKYGLSFVQMPVGNDGEIGVQTIYMHTSGEWITSVVKSPIVDSKQMNIYQSVGAAITYFRRYSLSAFVGIASDEDNDVATIKVEETPVPKPTPAKKPTKKVNTNPVSQTDEVILRGMLKELGDATVSGQVKEGLETGSINAKNVEAYKKRLEEKIEENSPGITKEEVDEVFS
tara:strand:+ start:135 stop:821 length:687 start_codon:yes stop_codon:yes gene_type:complete